MYCRVCGSESCVKWRGAQRNYLCDSCCADTPKKVSRSEFERAYWGNEKPIAGIANEFWEDYLNSECTLERYITETTSAF